MASFSREDNIDWLWGSLKPWQILHSTLAERRRCGNALDVWELVNQTLNASTVTRRHEGDGGRSRVPIMNFLEDIIDGDFWRHGGVLESRVKECLNRLLQEEEELVAAHHHHHHHHHHPSIYRCNSELSTVASHTTQLPDSPTSIAHGSIEATDTDDCRVGEHEEADDQEELHDLPAVLQGGATAEEEKEGNHGNRSEESEEEGEEEEEENSPYPNVHTIREDNYSLISSNSEVKHDYRDMSRESPSILVICSAAAGDDQLAAAPVWGETANRMGMEIVAPPDLEENIDVCAVCLEKLTHYYEEGVQALACRHAFHTVCIAPWLQCQPHACCPCCRSPIFLDNLPPPLHLADQSCPLELAMENQYACAGPAGVHGDLQPATNGIMSLLADMEAALERLGFRS